ncbi:MAG TPA: di-trans,poly-cis-decaprenylcistransferase [Halothiobacillus sp.]|nr:di-trans,poly-cis-decaprenylcistransferase [Halothiobacillus sp.]
MASGKRVPRHVAIVMDGNGRWAQQRMLPRTVGHQRGRRAVRLAIEAAIEQGVEALTLFAFSSENWARPADEVNTLMTLFTTTLRQELDELHKHDIRLRFIGDRRPLPAEARELMEAAELRTAGNQRLQLCIAISYGGRWDILQAARRVNEICSQDCDDATYESAFEAALSTHGLPPLDLFIRTGGERRVSNFLLWQLAYAELWFTDTLWPDFSKDSFAEAVAWFASRDRRFGRI